MIVLDQLLQKYGYVSMVTCLLNVFIVLLFKPLQI